MTQNTPLPLVPQNAYTQAILKELHAVPYDPTHHNGMRNPYSHKKVMNQQDYEEYVREYVYYRLCDELVIKKYTEQLAQDVQQLETQHRSKIRQLNDEHEKAMKGHRRRWLLLAACLVLVIIFTFARYIPNKVDASYESGHTDGFKEGKVFADQSTYESGYSAGYAQAFADGLRSSTKESSNSNSSSSSSGRSSSSSNTTPGFFTDPIAGISLTRTVYVSQRSHTIHLNSGCSGMKNYFTMSYEEACAAGYGHCRTCF